MRLRKEENGKAWSAEEGAGGGGGVGVGRRRKKKPVDVVLSSKFSLLVRPSFARETKKSKQGHNTPFRK